MNKGRKLFVVGGIGIAVFGSALDSGNIIIPVLMILIFGAVAYYGYSLMDADLILDELEEEEELVDDFEEGVETYGAEEVARKERNRQETFGNWVASGDVGTGFRGF